MISTKNWTHCCYQQDKLIAQIQYGAVPTLSDNSYQEIYSVLVMDEDYKTIFIKDFNNLDQSCEYLNNHYQHWSFKDLEAQIIEKNASEGGCSSCQAH